MNFSQIHNALFQLKMPGFLLGLKREPGAENKYMSHVYRGSFNDVGDPMCKRGWNRGEGYSIWRNNIGRGICRTCIKAVEKDLTNPSPPQR